MCFFAFIQKSHKCGFFFVESFASFICLLNFICFNNDFINKFRLITLLICRYLKFKLIKFSYCYDDDDFGDSRISCRRCGFVCGFLFFSRFWSGRLLYWIQKFASKYLLCAIEKIKLFIRWIVRIYTHTYIYMYIFMVITFLATLNIRSNKTIFVKWGLKWVSFIYLNVNLLLDMF